MYYIQTTTLTIFMQEHQSHQLEQQHIYCSPPIFTILMLVIAYLLTVNSFFFVDNLRKTCKRIFIKIIRCAKVWIKFRLEISAIEAVNMKLRVSGNLKRKSNESYKRKAPEEQLSVPKLTTVEHYLQLISDTWISWIYFLKWKVALLLWTMLQFMFLEWLNP